MNCYQHGQLIILEIQGINMDNPIVTALPLILDRSKYANRGRYFQFCPISPNVTNFGFPVVQVAHKTTEMQFMAKVLHVCQVLGGNVACQD